MSFAALARRRIGRRGYLSLPGATGCYASTPSSTALNITGDLDLRLKVAMTDWTPSTQQDLMSKYGASGHRSYMLYLGGDGKPGLIVSATGSGVVTATSSAATSVADGAVKWVRTTRVAATGVVKFYLSDDGASWAQLGTDVSSTASAIYASDAEVEVGASVGGTSHYCTGKFHRAQILNGIDGTVVLDANFVSTGRSFVEPASGATVTVHGATAVESIYP